MSVKKSRTVQIENLCIINVACRFADFCDPKSSYRGPNFTWDWFVGHVQQEASTWLLMTCLKETIDEAERALAEQKSKEFAEYLIKKLSDSTRTD